jgi:glycosyltransferase involved in cell wall biosynthesis
MNPQGGSELYYKNLLKNTGQDWQQRINLIMSFCNLETIDPNRINVVLQELMHNEGAVAGMDDPVYVDRMDHFVYVSQWQLDRFRERFNIEHANNHVIRNAVPAIPNVLKSKEKIRLIYTSTPYRGLDVLLDAFEMLNREDIELHVYSSNVIYGTGYAKTIGSTFDHLFNRCRTMKNVVYKGWAMNKAIQLAVQQAHIHAYPSTFEETSCMAVMETGMAGCKIVTTNLGALPETCGPWATYVDYKYGDDRKQLVKNYAEVLNKEIDNYWTNTHTLNEQSLWFNAQYSWETRTPEWLNFFNNICVK